MQAKFSKSLGKAVIVSTAPDSLHIVDPKTALDFRVMLPAPVKLFSLSQDGTLAAVLHEGLVSLVDLNLGILLHTSAVVSAPTDVFVKNSGLLYLTGQTPGNPYSPVLTELDGRTGASVQTVSTIPSVAGILEGIYSEPLNKYFTFTANFSPDQIYAIEFDPGTGSFSGTSTTPYWGTYSISAPFWLSTDQSLLFTAAGTYFNTSDLTYVGSLMGLVLSMSHSSTAQEAVVLQGRTFNYLSTGFTPNYVIFPSAYKRFTGPLLVSAGDVNLPTVGGLTAYGRAIFHAGDDSHVVLVQTGSPQPDAAGLHYYLLSF